jgi:hypothetical protein
LAFVAEVTVLAANAGGEHAAAYGTAVAADVAVDTEAYSPICWKILILVFCFNRICLREIGRDLPGQV